MVNCLGMNYSKSIILSIKKDTFDHTVLLRYCAILSEEIELNLLGMNSPQNIKCSSFIENHTVHFRYRAILCILDTVLYCAILCYTVHLGMNSPKNILCSSLIENQKKSHTVLYCAILCILDTVLYCGKK